MFINIPTMLYNSLLRYKPFSNKNKNSQDEIYFMKINFVVQCCLIFFVKFVNFHENQISLLRQLKGCNHINFRYLSICNRHNNHSNFKRRNAVGTDISDARVNQFSVTWTILIIRQREREKSGWIEIVEGLCELNRKRFSGRDSNRQSKLCLLRTHEAHECFIHRHGKRPVNGCLSWAQISTRDTCGRA